MRRASFTSMLLSEHLFLLYSNLWLFCKLLLTFSLEMGPMLLTGPLSFVQHIISICMQVANGQVSLKHKVEERKKAKVCITDCHSM